METDERKSLAKVRLERAKELLLEAKDLLEKNSYKSANNRAYYSIEKAIKALLAIKGVDAKTHSGVLHLFNSEYIHPGEYFTHDDYEKFKAAEYIRTASDYDDFYVASKDDCMKQIDTATDIVSKVEQYLG